MKNNKQKLIGKSGVYTWLVNDKVKYIGSATGNLETRYSNHKSNLKYNKHPNKELQELYNEHGKDAFKFYVLDYSNIDSCLELEKLHMLIHQDTLVKQNEIINTTRKVRTEEEQQQTSKKLSKAMRGENNPNAKLNEQEAGEVLFLRQNGVKIREVAEIYKISQTHVSNIGKTKWVDVVAVKPAWYGHLA